MTPEQLSSILPFAGVRIAVFVKPLTDAMAEFAINSAKRQAAFLAQVAHESAQLKYMSELADGSAYEGRVDLGNDQPGDGVKYKGHGPIQITGKRNHMRCGVALGVDLLTTPLLLTDPVIGCRGAGWFWKDKNLNIYADTDKFGSLSHAINGGYNGIDERISYWLRARTALGVV